MKLGIQVGLGRGRIVLDVATWPAPPPLKGHTPIFIRSSPGDDLMDWNPCVRPSVRTSTKSFFSDFYLIWCVGRPRPDMRTSVTSTRSKVKVKVMELLKLRKLHFSRFISSAVLAWSSKLMVDGYSSMGPGQQLVEA